MGSLIRTMVALAGMAAALGWSALFVRAPGVAMEQLVLTSPIVVTVWLIVMLSASTRPRRMVRSDGAPAIAAAAPAAIQDAVRTRDGRRCVLCGGADANTVAARRPGRRADADPLDRYVTLCRTCAAAGALSSQARTPARTASRPAGSAVRRR